MSDKKQIESKAVPSKAADADNPNPNDENDNLDQVVEATDILKSVQLTDDAPAEPVEEEDPDEEEIEAKIPENLKEALETLKNDDSIQGFFGHNDSVFCVALSPTDEKLALSGDGADKAYLWDITSGDTLLEVDGHKDSVCSCGFSFDGKYFATASMDGTVKVFNTSDRSLAHVLDGPSAEIEFMAWHPKGHVIAAGSADNTCWVWNAANGQCMHALSGHQGPVMCGTWTEDGKTLCTGSEDGIFVWNMKTGKPRHHIKGHGAHEGPVTCLAAHHDPAQPLLLSASQDGSAKIFHLDTGKMLQTLRGHSDSVETVAFCRVMPWCATGGVDGQVIVFDVRNGQTRVKFNHEDAVTHLEWHPKEPLLFTASVDKTVRLWDARSGAQVQTWKGHTDAILEFALSKDGTTIVTASDDRTALVFSTAPQPPGPVFAVSAAAPPPAK